MVGVAKDALNSVGNFAFLANGEHVRREWGG
jgi:hypothetical protein